MKKLLAILGIIISSMPAYSAQWSGAGVKVEDIKAIFEKYAPANSVENMIKVFSVNVGENGLMAPLGFVRICHAGGLKGKIGTDGYKKCESLVLDMVKLAKKANGTSAKTGGKSGSGKVEMSPCENDVRLALISKATGQPLSDKASETEKLVYNNTFVEESGSVSGAAIRDGLVKYCGFTEKSYFGNYSVSEKHANALIKVVLSDSSNCRIDHANSMFICGTNIVAFRNIGGAGDIMNKTYRENVAKALCYANSAVLGNSHGALTWEDIANTTDPEGGCPTPNAVRSCEYFQEQLKLIDSRLFASEKGQGSSKYCVVSAKQQKKEGVNYEANLTKYADVSTTINNAVRMIETDMPELSCSYRNWYNAGIYSVFCRKGKTADYNYGFRFAKLTCDVPGFEYDEDEAVCKEKTPGQNNTVTLRGINNRFFERTSVMELQANALVGVYFAHQGYGYQDQSAVRDNEIVASCPAGNDCGAKEIVFKFYSVDGRHQGNVANQNITEAVCRMYNSSYSKKGEDYAHCGLSKGTCEQSFKTDIQIVNSSMDVFYNDTDGKCVVYWGKRPEPETPSFLPAVAAYESFNEGKLNAGYGTTYLAEEKKKEEPKKEPVQYDPYGGSTGILGVIEMNRRQK